MKSYVCGIVSGTDADTAGNVEEIGRAVSVGFWSSEIVAASKVVDIARVVREAVAFVARFAVTVSAETV